MKQNKYLFILLSLCLALAACSSEEELGYNAGKSVKFTSQIEGQTVSTRVSGTTWDAEDAIGVFMLNAGAELSASSVLADNKKYVVSGSGSQAFEPDSSADLISFPEADVAVDFIAYYPYSVALSEYAYPVDVATQISQSAIDLLYSNGSKNLTATGAAIGLKFKHKLAKLVFNVSSDIEDISDLKIEIKGVSTKALFNLATAELTIDATSDATIDALMATDGKTAEAIIIPGNAPAGFVFTLGTKVWSYTPEKTYEEGIKYIYNVTLNNDNSTDTSGSEEEWTDNPGGETGGGSDGGSEATIGNVELDMLYGYAEGTTGGEGGEVYHFDNGKKFTAWLKLRENNKSSAPAIVWLSGTFTKSDGRDTGSPWFDVKATSNLTIIGTKEFKMKNVGFFLNGAENIIMRNIHIVLPKADNGADGISIQKSSKVWIDHCTFESENQTSDYEDGSVDVTHKSNQVTVSWNKFINTQKSCLVGHSNNYSEDVVITATFHHNFFNKSSSRHPRVRFGQVHVYNNFYDGVTTYGVGSAYGAKVLVEYNSFDNVQLPTDICTYPAKVKGNSMVSNLTGSVAGYLYAAENDYTNVPSNASSPYPFTNVEYTAYNGDKLGTALTYADFKPTYNYVVDEAALVPEIVAAGAGAGVLTKYDTAPVEVDNGGIADEDVEDLGGEEEEETESATQLGGGWSAMDIGAAAGTDTLSDDYSSISIAGLGKFESGSQTFRFIYTEITGSFTITAQLDSYSPATASNQALAGLLLTPDVSATGTNFLHALSGKGGNGGYCYSHRLSIANASRGNLLASPADVLPVFKLRREGSKYYASYSEDGGATFSKEKEGTFTDELPETLYVGLAVGSGSNSASSVASFSNIQLNGEQVYFID